MATRHFRRPRGSGYSSEPKRVSGWGEKGRGSGHSGNVSWNWRTFLFFSRASSVFRVHNLGSVKSNELTHVTKHRGWVLYMLAKSAQVFAILGNANAVSGTFLVFGLVLFVLCFSLFFVCWFFLAIETWRGLLFLQDHVSRLHGPQEKPDFPVWSRGVSAVRGPRTGVPDVPEASGEENPPVLTWQPPRPLDTSKQSGPSLTRHSEQSLPSD